MPLLPIPGLLDENFEFSLHEPPANLKRIATNSFFPAHAQNSRYHFGTLETNLTSLVPIMLKSAEGWDQVAAFVALTMLRKMEIARERQGRPIAAAT